MILDTNAVSAWWQGNDSLTSIISNASAVYLVVPVLAEFRFGILKSSRRSQMETWLDEATRATTFLAADTATAECYAQTRYEMEAKGRKIPMNDLWIAAIARQHRLPILSRDTHFDLVENLERISW
jgi:predicted nucleic acid-binding protein